MYAIARIAVLGQLIDDPVRLVGASGHLSRAGTVAGGVGTALGALLLAVGGPEHLLVVGSAGHLVAALVGLRLPVAPVPSAVAVAPGADALAVDVVAGLTPADDPFGDVRVATLPVSDHSSRCGCRLHLPPRLCDEAGRR